MTEIPSSTADATNGGALDKSAARSQGFSDRINDPALDAFRSQQSRSAQVFTFVLAILVVVGFPIYGVISGEMDFPGSLYLGLGIGGMIVAIMFITRLRQSRDTTWDGTVIDKRTRERTRVDGEQTRNVTVFEYVVKRDDGKIFREEAENDAMHFTYYAIGDRVRHHKGFPFYEKRDKGNPGVILCIYCGAINDHTVDACVGCGCPLMN